MKHEPEDSLDPVHRELYESKERLRAIIDTMTDGIITIDQQGTIENVNPAIESIFGYKKEELVGSNVRILMPQPYRDEHDSYIKHYLETGEAKIIGVGREVPCRRKDGSLFQADLTISEVDHLGIFTGIIRDISDRIEVEKSLHREHELNESIINTAHAIILVLDPQCRIVRFNPFFEKLTGFTLNEVQGKDWFEVFVPEPQRADLRQQFNGFLEESTIWENVNPIVTKSGQELLIAWWSKTLKNSEVSGVLSMGQDITELKRTQDRLLQVERLSAIGEAMTGLTHESRNALARSQANLRRLSRRLKGQAELLALIDGAITAQEDLRQLFEDVRQYAAPINLKLQTTDIGQLINEAWEQLATSREGREIEFHHSPATFNLKCEIDTFHARNAIRNILENSLSACNDPVKIEIGYTEIRIAERDYLRIAIRDNGPGLTPEQARNAFDAFFTTKTHGTGLGLAIVKRLIEQHRGEVRFNENFCDGAELVLTLSRFQK